MASPVWRTLAKYSSTSSRAASVTTANGKASYRRSSVDLDPNRSTVDMIFVVRRLQELARKDTPMFMCLSLIHI